MYSRVRCKCEPAKKYINIQGTIVISATICIYSVLLRTGNAHAYNHYHESACRTTSTYSTKKKGDIITSYHSILNDGHRFNPAFGNNCGCISGIKYVPDPL